MTLAPVGSVIVIAIRIVIRIVVVAIAAAVLIVVTSALPIDSVPGSAIGVALSHGDSHSGSVSPSTTVDIEPNLGLNRVRKK